MKKLFRKNTDKQKKEQSTTESESVTIKVEHNMPVVVYGPPAWFRERKSAQQNEPDQNIPEGVYGPPAEPRGYGMIKGPDPDELDPAQNEPQEVYGPPWEYDSSTAEHNVPELIYGPPWAMGIDDDSSEGNA